MRIWQTLVFVLSACILRAECLTNGPFAGIDPSLLSKKERLIIGNANEDFNLVQTGKKPLHAKVDREAPLPADGGTTFWKADGYRLTIFQSISTFGTLNGFVYGPHIQFDEHFAPGNMDYVSSIRFYTLDQFNSMMSKEATNMNAKAFDGSGSIGNNKKDRP